MKVMTKKTREKIIMIMILIMNNYSFFFLRKISYPHLFVWFKTEDRVDRIILDPY
jgi:hypothetical protein